jgi:hypothetical protein
LASGFVAKKALLTTRPFGFLIANNRFIVPP